MERDELTKNLSHGEVLLPTICDHPESVATLLGIVHPMLAASHVAELNEDGLPAPASQSPKHLVALAFWICQLSVPDFPVLPSGRAPPPQRKDRKSFTPSPAPKKANATF